MRKLAIAIHVLAIAGVVAINAALAYAFIDSGSGSYWGGTLRIVISGYAIPALALETALILGIAVILISGARVVQLISGGRRFATYPGLRMAGNTLLIVILMILIAAGRENHIFTYLIENVFGGQGKQAAPALQSDAEVSFPSLPLPEDLDPLASLEFKGMDGAVVKFADLKGKVVFLNIWATWCPPCRAEMPNIDKLHEQMKNEPDIVFMLASNEAPEDVKTFLAKTPHTAPIYTVTDETLRKLKISSFPTTLFVSKSGEVIFSKTGSAAWDGGTTREFLLALARDLPFTPFKNVVEKITLPKGFAFEERIVSADSEAMDLACATDGTIYYADYFKKIIGRIDPASGSAIPILEGLNSPKSLTASGEWLYFTEVGTTTGKYKDGSLARMRLPSGPREVIAANLQYPNSVFIAKDGAIYVTEAPGGCTSFGGTDRLIVFGNGSTTGEQIFETEHAPEAVVLDSEGNIYVGEMGRSSAGDTGRVRRYPAGSTRGKVIVSNLPAVQDIVIDSGDNLFVAGNSRDTRTGISMITKGASEFVPVKNCGMVTGMGMDSKGNIYYSPRGRISVLMKVQSTGQ